MNDTRYKTLFALRYAVRVLERQSALWGKVGAALKLFAVLSGTGAVAALTGSNTQIALGLSVLFAVLQALAHVADPAERRSCANAQRREYARVLARQASQDDAALEAAYQAVVADDDLVVSQRLKELAYNDVVIEKGLPASANYPDRAWLRALS